MADMRCKQCGQYYDDRNRSDCPHCEREAQMEVEKRARAVSVSTGYENKKRPREANAQKQSPSQSPNAASHAPPMNTTAEKKRRKLPEWRLLVTDRGANGTMPRAGAFLWFVAFFLLPLLACVVGYVLVQSDESYQPARTLRDGFLVFVIGVALVSVPFTVVAARRVLRKGAVEILNEDLRPPILLLRSFADDGLGVSGTRATLEIILERKLSPFGPVVAIGRPGERVPPFGAARFWVDDEHWQLAINKLVPLCQCVVLILGKASNQSGLAWEVEQVFLDQTPKLLWIIIPPKNEDWIRRRWDEYKDLVGERFPDYAPGVVLIAFRPMSVRVYTVNKHWFWGYVRDEGAYQGAIAAAQVGALAAA